MLNLNVGIANYLYFVICSFQVFEVPDYIRHFIPHRLMIMSTDLRRNISVRNTGRLLHSTGVGNYMKIGAI